MANSRELSQFGRLVEIKDGTHIGIGTQSDVAIGFGTITAIRVGDSNTVYYGDGSNLSGVSASGAGSTAHINAESLRVGFSTFRERVVFDEILEFRGLEIGGANSLDWYDSSAVLQHSILYNGEYFDIGGGDHVQIDSTGVGTVFITNAGVPVAAFAENTVKFSNALTETETLRIDPSNNVVIAGALNVSGVSTFSSQINLNGNLDMGDGDIIKLGTGDDLSIYHDGTDSQVLNTGGGYLTVTNVNERVNIRAVYNEDGIVVQPNSHVQLFYDGNEKLYTKSDGVDIVGELQCDTLDVDGDINIENGNIVYSSAYNALDLMDNVTLRFGTGRDLRIGHTGSYSYIRDTGTGNIVIAGDANVDIYNYALNEAKARFITNGAVELYYDGSKKFETATGGITVTGTINGHTIPSGSGTFALTSDLTSYATTSYVDTEVAGIVDSAPGTLNTLNELAAALGDDANFSTTVTNSIAAKMPLAGGTFTGDVTFNDNVKAKFGTGNDLQIYHDESHSRIVDSGTGHLIIQTSELDLMNAAGNEDMLKATQDGSVEIYHNGNKKLETTSSGVTVSGDANVTGNVNSSSDVSLKENIVPIDDALNKVLAMTGVEYDRIDMDGVHQIGVIAQEIEKVIPELVTENETTGLKSVSYGNITAVLIEAIKQQQEQINILRNKLNEL